MRLRLPRPEDQRDLVLYLPDEILIVDHMRQHSAVHRYEFEVAGEATRGLPRATPPAPYPAGGPRPPPPPRPPRPRRNARPPPKAHTTLLRGGPFQGGCRE